jgi:pimeloyl-ACP methyl ester carboxylesterase
MTRSRLLTGATEQSHQLGDARIFAVEMGEGPLVLFVHGFPESWYSWRHQLPAVAEAGYRAVAIDVRGYGRSSKPPAVVDYRMVRLVADNVRLVEHLGASGAVIVGHDWGAPIAWSSCLLRPDVFNALALLSVPYTPPGADPPTEMLARLVGPENEFYMNYFQEPGRMEAEAEEDLRGLLAGFYLGASGDAPADMENFAVVPRGRRLRDMLPGTSATLDLPWMTPDDFEFYAAEFERTGLTGGLNRYRNLDRDVEDLAAFRDHPITVPSLFIGGEKDGPTIWGAGAIARFDRTLPDCRGVHVLAGSGHWIQQERAEEVNRLLLEFLGVVRPVGDG